MKRTFGEKVSDLTLKSIKPLVFVWMKFATNIIVTKESDVDFKRKEPFVLLGNHVSKFDVVELALRFRKTPLIVASQLLLTKQPLKFLLTYIARCIPKSKGEADIRTAKHLLKSIRKKYPVMIMPEGDATFFGETGYIEYSTAKLIKKLKVDVIVGLFKGGYLSSPRWATSKRKNRRVELHYSKVISKEEIKDLSVDEIYSIICESMYNNDYNNQREKMINYGGENLAEGLTHILYTCPVCEGLNTIETNGNYIKCTKCGTEGHVDEFGFIHGFKYDNVCDWNKFQLKFTDRLKESSFSTKGQLSYIDLKNQLRESVGTIYINYKEGKFYLSGPLEVVLKIEELIYPVITIRRNFSFEYDGIYYFIVLDDCSLSFLRVCQDKY